MAVLRAPLRATSGRGGRAQTSARGAHRVSQGPGDAFVHSEPTGSPPPGSSLTPRAFLGFKSTSAGAVLTRLKTCCVSRWTVWREGSVRPKGPGQGGHRGPQGRERASGWAPGHGGSAPGSALKVSCTPLRKGRHHSVTTFCEVTLGQECRCRLHFVYPGVCLRRQSSQMESPDVPRPQEVRWHVLPRALTTEPLGARTWPPQPRTPCIPALWPGS